MTQKKVEKHIKTQKKQNYFNSNNFLSIIDTDKIKTDLESLDRYFFSFY